MIDEQKENAISNMDDKYGRLKQFICEIDESDFEGNYNSFIKGINYIVKNDSDVCEILDDLILISKHIDNISESEELTNVILNQLEEITLYKISSSLGISKKYLISNNDAIVLYPKKYTKIDGEEVSILYNFENYQVEYIIEDKKEEIETNTIIKMCDEEIIYVNNELCSLFDGNTKKDIENTLCKVYDAMRRYANYKCVFLETISKINKDRESEQIHKRM